jgi:hypothetical protein
VAVKDARYVIGFPQVDALVVRQLRKEISSVVFGLTPAMSSDAEPLRPLIDLVTDDFADVFQVTRKIGSFPAIWIFRLVFETVASTMQGAVGSAHATVWACTGGAETTESAVIPVIPPERRRSEVAARARERGLVKLLDSVIDD